MLNNISLGATLIYLLALAAQTTIQFAQNLLEALPLPTKKAAVSLSPSNPKWKPKSIVYKLKAT